MKLVFTPTGPWERVKRLFASHRERVEFLERKVLMDSTEQLKKDVLSNLPNESRAKEYGDAIKEAEFTGSLRKGEMCYGLYASDKELELKDLDKTYDVVYVLPAKEPVSLLGALCIEYSPWTVDKLPENVGAAKDVKLVTRRVTSEEVEKVRTINNDVLKKESAKFKEAEAKLPRTVDEIEKPKAMSDLKFQALRWEFGLKEKQIAHWKPAVGMFWQRIKERVQGSNEYERIIGDDRYSQWKSDPENWEKIPIQEIDKNFQKKVAK